MSESLVIDIEGTKLTPEDKEILSHPLVGGVILFSRNFIDKKQLTQLTTDIKNINREQSLFISVDQEGGRIQRFQEGFTPLPSARNIGELYNRNHEQGINYAKASGFCMAAELIECGVDLSFSPVLDVDHGLSDIIGCRSFHQDPAIVTQLAEQYILGMKQAGMIAVGKHFPGHGAVKADSHLELPVDDRNKKTIEAEDFIVFKQLIEKNLLPAVMTAHIAFPAFDDKPVTFSAKWLKKILREELSFGGTIFSDDLTMAGAALYNDITTRVVNAFEAGCDYALICNDRKAVVNVLDNLNYAKENNKKVLPVNRSLDTRDLLLKIQEQLQHYRELCHDN